MDWAATIKEQSTSGLSVKDFCAERGISLDSFYNQRSILKRKGEQRFARVETKRLVTLEVEGGVTLRVSAEDLKVVLAALR